MPSLSAILEQNRTLADQISRDARSNPASPYAGKYVGIAGGQVVAVTDTLTEALGVLRLIEPDSSRRYCIEASRDYSAIDHIWETH